MPRVRLTAARALENFADAAAFDTFVVQLVNDRGEVVGVIQGGARNASLINYAISAAEVLDFVQGKQVARVVSAARRSAARTR